MQAVILSIGDELVLGQTVDTNAAWISQQLAQRGVFCTHHLTVDDDLPAIAEAFHWAAQRADLVIVTGGLGPTEDDLTRQALAEALGEELVTDARQRQRMEAFFAERNYHMSPRNLCQVEHPPSSTMLDNDRGTAPGLQAHLHGAAVFVFPGVPREMKPMLERYVLPTLPATGKTILATKVNTFGQGESTVAEHLGELAARDRNPLVGTTVSQGIVSVRIRAEFEDPCVAQDELDAAVAQVQQALGPIVFGRDEEQLQDVVLKLLSDRKQTLATAESCTGGLIGKLLTDVPGSSETYQGGWVTYTNTMKHTQLGVASDLLQQHGAVSAPVVQAMASGAAERSGSDYALAVSGIAGPDGGTETKPIGTVFLGIAYPSTAGHETLALQCRFPGQRASIRDRSAKAALQLLRLKMLGLPLDTLSWGSVCG